MAAKKQNKKRKDEKNKKKKIDKTGRKFLDKRKFEWMTVNLINKNIVQKRQRMNMRNIVEKRIGKKRRTTNICML